MSADVVVQRLFPVEDLRVLVLRLQQDAQVKVGESPDAQVHVRVDPVRYPQTQVVVSMQRNQGRGDLFVSWREQAHESAARPRDEAGSVPGVPPPTVSLLVPSALRTVSVESRGGDISLEQVPCERLSVYTARGAVQIRATSGFFIGATGRGDVCILGLAGEGVVTTGSGQVFAEQCSGLLRLHSGEGDILLRRFEGSRLSLRSGRGVISLDQVRADCVGVEVGVGALRLSDVSTSSLQAKVETGECLVAAELRPGEHSLTLQRGQVTLEIPSGTPLRFDLATGAGEIVCALPGVPVGRRGRPSPRGKRLVGRQGDGTVSLTVSVGRGDVTLRGR